MSTHSITRAISLIKEANENQRHVGQGSSMAMIEASESRLGVTFPEDYRRFLAAFSHGGIDGVEIMGIEAEWADGLSPDLFAINGMFRDEGLPERILLIEEIGDGSHYALDLQPGPEFGRVVVWPIVDGNPTELEETDVDFGDFLLRRVVGVLE